MASTTNDLMNYLESQSAAAAFVPYIEASKEADAINVYFRGDADYSERLTDHVTLYRSLDTDEIVGCRIKGISGIVEDLPNYIEINHDNVKLAVIFWSFRGGIDDEKGRNALNELVEKAGDLTLQPCA